jgi:hypothetical protein
LLHGIGKKPLESIPNTGSKTLSGSPDYLWIQTPSYNEGEEKEKGEKGGSLELVTRLGLGPRV